MSIQHLLLYNFAKAKKTKVDQNRFIPFKMSHALSRIKKQEPERQSCGVYEVRVLSTTNDVGCRVTTFAREKQREPTANPRHGLLLTSYSTLFDSSTRLISYCSLVYVCRVKAYFSFILIYSSRFPLVLSER